MAVLLDFESRLDTCSRIKRNYGLDCDYRTYSGTQLFELESRISAAHRVNRTYSVTLDWRIMSLDQILERERSLYSAAHPTVSQPSYPSSSFTYTMPNSGKNERDPAEKQALVEAFRKASTSAILGSRDSTNPSAFRGYHFVYPYLRRDGIYVRGHMKTNPDYRFWNNWSSFGNTNPFTGETGTKRP